MQNISDCHVIMIFLWLDHIPSFLCKTTVKFQFYCIFLRKSTLKGSMNVVCKELWITKHLKVEDASTDLNLLKQFTWSLGPVIKFLVLTKFLVFSRFLSYYFVLYLLLIYWEIILAPFLTQLPIKSFRETKILTYYTCR